MPFNLSIKKKGEKRMQQMIQAIFGGGSTVLSLYIIASVIELITIYLSSLKNHSWRSIHLRDRFLLKGLTFLTISTANVIDRLAFLMNLYIPLNVAFWWTIMMTLYEVRSILENLSILGVKIGFLSKYLKVLQDPFYDERNDVTSGKQPLNKKKKRDE